MKQITSSANPNFKQWLRIAQQPRAVRQFERSIAEGIHLAQAALNAAHPIEAALLRKGTQHAEIDALLDRCEAERIALYELPATLYDQLAPVEHGAGLSLVLAVPRRALPHRLREDALFLDGVQDPGNAGALLRIAAAAGVRHVIAGENTAALWAPKVLRGAQGAHFALSIYEGAMAEHLRNYLDGPWFGAAAHDAVSLWEATIPATPIGWVMGGEGLGLSAAARTQCATLVTIPIASAVESLNVAAAAAICLFERRRRIASTG